MKVLVNTQQEREEFIKMAELYSEELFDWRRHQEAAERGEAEAYPPPDADELVRKCIGEDGRPNFTIEVIDSSAEKLAQAKNQLFHEAQASADAQFDLLVPPGKRMLFQLKRQKILNTTVVSAELPEEVREQALLTRRERTQEEIDWLHEDTERQALIDALQWQLAEQLAEIEDLSDEELLSRAGL